jgi:2,5-dihydroxypyridine 5,6-dioxygenase
MPYGRTTSGPHAATELVGLYALQLRGCALRADETCLVVTDTAYDPVASAACLGAALEIGATAYVVTLPFTRPLPGASLAAAFADADLVVALTPHLVHYDPHLRAALDAGARALMAVQPTHVHRRLPADDAVIARTKLGAARLAQARTVRITSPEGTDLTMDVTGRPALAHYGVADEPGHFDFWGAAMVEIAQHEGTTEGTLVLRRGDQVFHLGRFVDDPVRITFEAGRAVAIEGGLDAFLIARHLDSYGEASARLAGHIAWGTDHRALWTASLVQFPEAGAGNADAEGTLGSVQVQLGSNDDQYFRGRISSRAHLGLSTLGSSLALDGEVVIDGGTFTGSLSACAPAAPTD